MTKKKFKYNPETLSYEEVELTWKDRLRKVSSHTISAIVFSVLVVAALYTPILQKGKRLAVQESEGKKIELEEFNERLEQLEKVLANLESTDDNIYRSIFEAEPYPQYKRVLGTGGNPKQYDKYKTFAHSEMVIETAKRLEQIEKRVVGQSRSFDEVISLIKSKEKMLLSVPSIQPIANRDLTRLASGFGMRMHPIYKILKMHTGIDFTADRGTEIFATGDGKVEKIGWMSGYGKMVVINHGFGYKTRYAHCDEYNVKIGQRVKRGDVIAFVGNTGASVGPHLHYEVHKNGAAVNPIHYFFNDLSPEEFEKVVEIASRPTQSM